MGRLSREMLNYLTTKLKYFPTTQLCSSPTASFIPKIQPHPTRESHVKPLTVLPGDFAPFSSIHATLLSYIPPRCLWLVPYLAPERWGSLIKKDLSPISVCVCLLLPLRRLKTNWRAGMHWVCFILTLIIVPNHIKFSTLDRIFNLNQI